MQLSGRPLPHAECSDLCKRYKHEAYRTSLAPSRLTWPTGQAWSPRRRHKTQVLSQQMVSRASLVPSSSKVNKTNHELKMINRTSLAPQRRQYDYKFPNMRRGRQDKPGRTRQTLRPNTIHRTSLAPPKGKQHSIVQRMKGTRVALTQMPIKSRPGTNEIKRNFRDLPVQSQLRVFLFLYFCTMSHKDLYSLNPLLRTGDSGLRVRYQDLGRGRITVSEDC